MAGWPRRCYWGGRELLWQERRCWGVRGCTLAWGTLLGREGCSCGVADVVLVKGIFPGRDRHELGHTGVPLVRRTLL